MGFDRSPDQSYDYFNTMKHGSVEQREALIREVFKDTVQEVSENVINLVESMAIEAHVPEMQREYLRQMQAEPAEMPYTTGKHPARWMPPHSDDKAGPWYRRRRKSYRAVS